MECGTVHRLEPDMWNWILGILKDCVAQCLISWLSTAGRS